MFDFSLGTSFKHLSRWAPTGNKWSDDPYSPTNGFPWGEIITISVELWAPTTYNFITGLDLLKMLGKLTTNLPNGGLNGALTWYNP